MAGKLDHMTVQDYVNTLKTKSLSLAPKRKTSNYKAVNYMEKSNPDKLIISKKTQGHMIGWSPLREIGKNKRLKKQKTKPMKTDEAHIQSTPGGGHIQVQRPFKTPHPVRLIKDRSEPWSTDHTTNKPVPNEMGKYVPDRKVDEMVTALPSSRAHGGRSAGSVPKNAVFNTPQDGEFKDPKVRRKVSDYVGDRKFNESIAKLKNESLATTGNVGEPSNVVGSRRRRDFKHIKETRKQLGHRVVARVFK